MNQERISELDRLIYEEGMYRRSDEFKELLDFIKRFPDLAPFNAMLIHLQKPDSIYVAAAAEWGKKFNCEIKPGARPLILLRPFGPVAFVYDLTDTTGNEPLPNHLIKSSHISKKTEKTMFENLTKNLACDGIAYVEKNSPEMETPTVEISHTRKQKVIHRRKKKYYMKTIFQITAHKQIPQLTRLSAVLGDLAHIYLGHLGSRQQSWLNDRQNLGKMEEEFEAEIVRWLVSERKGFNNHSAVYWTDYCKNNEFIPNVSVDAILKATAMIETLFRNGKKFRKEIVIRVENNFEQLSFNI